MDLIDVQYAEMDDLYAAMDNPSPSYTNFEPIKIDYVLQAQLYDKFRSEIRRTFNEGGFGILNQR